MNLSQPEQPQGQRFAVQDLENPYAPPGPFAWHPGCESPHPEIITQPALLNSKNELAIYPLTKNHAYWILNYWAGKHYFWYYPETNKYIYYGRVTFLNAAAKHNRLYELLADYTHGLIDCALERNYPDSNPEDYNLHPEERGVEAHEKMYYDLRHLRGATRAVSTKEFPGDLATSLRTWKLPALMEKYKRQRYYKCFDFMAHENVMEMFALLMDEDCKEIRKLWDEVFVAHVVATDKIKDIPDDIEEILDHTDYLDRWQEREWVEEKECAERWLYEGNFRDLVVVYDVKDWAEDDYDIFDRGERYPCQLEEEEDDDESEEDYGDESEEEYDDESEEDYDGESEEYEGSDEGYHSGELQVEDDATLEESSSPSPTATPDPHYTAKSSPAGKRKTAAKTKNTGKGKAVDRTVSTGGAQKGKSSAPTAKPKSTKKTITTTTTTTTTTIKIERTSKTSATPKNKTAAPTASSSAEAASKKRKESPCKPAETVERTHIMETRRKKVKHVRWRSDV